MNIREQHDRTKKNVKHQDKYKEPVPITLLDCALLVIDYVSFRINYLMYNGRKY